MNELLAEYYGYNPFLLYLKNQSPREMTDFESEYVNRNFKYCGYKFNDLKIGVGRRNVEYLNEQFNTSKDFSEITIDYLWGETDDIYHFGYKKRSFFVYKNDCENPFDKEIENVSFDPKKYNEISSRTLFDYQIKGIKFMLKNNPAFNWDEMGLGKMASYDSNILTPNGWIKMRDVKVGTLIIGSSGQPINVIGVFPQSVKKMYNVTFTDGTIVEVCGEHLWHVYKPEAKYRNRSTYHIKSTLELKQDLFLGKTKNLKWYIPIVNCVEFKPQPITIDPYLLGCLLGDGGLSGNNIFLTNVDEEILSECEKRLPDNVYLQRNVKRITYRFNAKDKINNDLLKYLKQVGLMGTKSNTKFIPNEYIYNTKQIRLELLQGLLDTDGYCAKDGTVQYYTTSKQLLDSVREIVLSLGGIAKQSSKIGKYKKNGVTKECKICYTLTINLPENIIPFKLTRKIANLKVDKKYHPCRGIKSIEFSRMSDGQCLAVDAMDSLYVMDDYVVTHNTTQSIVTTLECKYKKILVVTLASLKLNWKREIGMYKESAKIISGSEWDNSPSKFTIINYEILKNFVQVKKSKIKTLSNALLNENFDCIILDEVHRCKNPSSIQSSCLKLICASTSVKKIIGLSGTPFEKNVDFFNICRVLNVKVSDVVLNSSWYLENIENYRDYVLRYCNAYEQVLDSPKLKLLKAEILEVIPETTRKHKYIKTVLNIISQHGSKSKKVWTIVIKGVVKNVSELTLDDCSALLKEGYDDKRKKVLVLGRKVGDKKIENTNSVELQQRIKHIQIIRKKKDVLHNFPEKFVFPLYFDLSQKERLEYNEMWKEYLDNKPIKIYTPEELEKISESIKIREFLAKLKVSHTCNFVENKIEDGYKIIIFTHFKDEYESVLKYFGKSAVGINASMSTQKKQDNIDKFQTDDNIKVIVGNIKTLGTGHNLTKGDIVIVNSPDWNSGEHEQGEDRAYRIGRNEDVAVYYCLFEGTHEEEVFERSKQKKENKQIIMQS